MDLPICHMPQARHSEATATSFMIHRCFLLLLQATRACFTVYGRPLLGSKVPRIPVGWVSMPLFDHKDVLASGLYSLRLW